MLPMKLCHFPRNSRFNGMNKQHSRVKPKSLAMGPWAALRLAPGPHESHLLQSPCSLPRRPPCHSCVWRALPCPQTWALIFQLGSQATLLGEYPRPPCVKAPTPPQLPFPPHTPISSITLTSSSHIIRFLVYLLVSPTMFKPRDKRDFSLLFTLPPLVTRTVPDTQQALGEYPWLAE